MHLCMLIIKICVYAEHVKVHINPEDCLFVDDSYSNLEFAKQAGLSTVRIYYNNNSAKDKEYIDMAFKGIDGFLDAALAEN